ncbi:hypothetical protein ABID96_002890 [Bacillus sp. OAE603]
MGEDGTGEELANSVNKKNIQLIGCIFQYTA